MFEMYNHDYCNDDKKIGTYVTAVPDFMTGWLAEKEQQAADNGNDDYAVPDVAQYVQCTAFEIQGVAYYMQLGCADDDTKAIAVNIYEDNACTVRSSRDGYDDANFDVSDLQVSCCLGVLCFYHTCSRWHVYSNNLSAKIQILPKMRELDQCRGCG